MAALKNASIDERMETWKFFGNGTKEPTNWTKGTQLGRGAYGEVYKANIEHLGVTFELAVKRVKTSPELNGQNIAESQVKREIEALKKLRHERIVQYYNFNFHKKSFYIFIELMHGGSLENFISKKNDRKERIDELYAGRIIKQVIEAVGYLHQNKRFHRDIKSANVLMSDENNVKLADFGLTREYATITKTYTNEVGTIRFMAPEMFSVDEDGKSIKYNKSVDIWAVGCIVVHMLTGQHPFPNLERQHIMYLLATKEDPSPAQDILQKVTASCRSFFEKTLVRNPNARATAVKLLKHSFVTGKVSDINTDAEMDESNVLTENNIEAVIDETNAKLQEFDVREDLHHQPATTNVTIGKQYTNCTTNITFQEQVNFNSVTSIGKIDHLNVERLEKLEAANVGKVDVRQASGSFNVGQAEALTAQASSVHVQQANKVKTADTKTVNVQTAGKVQADRPENVNVDQADSVNIN